MTIRAGDLDAGREHAVGRRPRDVDSAYDRRRSDWLYRADPAGLGHLRTDQGGAPGEVIGGSSAFPRRMRTEGRQVTGWLGGVFPIEESPLARHAAMVHRSATEDAAVISPVIVHVPSQSRLDSLTLAPYPGP